MLKIAHLRRIFERATLPVMGKRAIVPLILAGAAFIAIVPLFFLPISAARIAMSPDEAANAFSARVFRTDLAMRVDMPILTDLPWLHPRSFVSQGPEMVPVGFLGLPMILGTLSLIFGDLIFLLFTPFLVASVVYPLSRITEGWKRPSRLLMIAAWLTFPTVVLYADRGLFPNLNVVCLTIWSLYLIWRRRSAWRCVASGALLGLAIAIRPIEAFWILPWVWLAWRERKDPQELSVERTWITLTSLGVFVVAFVHFFVAYRTYGDPFAIGYWLHDAAVSSGGPDASAASRWPFGFHPMHVWFNVKNYFGVYLWPWMVIAVLSVIVSWKRRSVRRMILVGIWTVISLCLIYGQAVYQDHVGLNVTSTGNSFLRYLLPIAPLIVLAIGSGAEWVLRCMKPVPARTLLATVGVLLSVFGIWTAFAKDDEGLLATAKELQGYAALRASMDASIPKTAIILSDRSDKIFFPDYLSASPLPPLSEVMHLLSVTDAPVYLYARTLDEQTKAQLDAAGIKAVQFIAGPRESLYLLST